MRVRVRCFGKDNGGSFVFAPIVEIYDTGDRGVLGAGDENKPGDYQANQPLEDD